MPHVVSNMGSKCVDFFVVPLVFALESKEYDTWHSVARNFWCMHTAINRGASLSCGCINESNQCHRLCYPATAVGFFTYTNNTEYSVCMLFQAEVELSSETRSGPFYACGLTQH
jgi:hypothetical protein